MLVVRTSFLEAETFELRLVGASLEKALEKGVLGREKGRVRMLKCTNLERFITKCIDHFSVVIVGEYSRTSCVDNAPASVRAKCNVHNVTSTCRSVLAGEVEVY